MAEDAARVPADLVALAQGFEHRLSSLRAHLDPSWPARLAGRWPVLQWMTDAALYDATLRSLILHDVRDFPTVARLAGAEGRIALLPRESLHRALGALALACRPGVLRCCIDRQAQAALADALGPFFEPLQQLSAGGAPVSAQAAAWSPLHWACRGCLDWMNMLSSQDQLLRRVVCLSMPAGLLGMHRRGAAARAELRPQRALRRLQDLGVAWPC